MLRKAGFVFVGEMDDGCDLLALLALYRSRQAPGEAVDFVLMQHLDGVEVGVGAYFNGEREASADPQAYDADARGRLRELSERLTATA